MLIADLTYFEYASETRNIIGGNKEEKEPKKKVVVVKKYENIKQDSSIYIDLDIKAGKESHVVVKDVKVTSGNNSVG